MGKKREEKAAPCEACDESKACPEKTEGASAAAGGTVDKAAKEPKVVKVSTFVFKDEPGESQKKLPQQCAQILGLIKDAGEEGILKADLLSKMTPIIVTKQPIERILGFYQPRLVKEGYVEVK